MKQKVPRERIKMPPRGNLTERQGSKQEPQEQHSNHLSLNAM
jgi:hypothetical protein